MSTYKPKGIIVRRNSFGESNLILSIYTKDYGKIEAVARSAVKKEGKLKGHLELFLCTELIFARGRNIDTIANSFTVESFLGIRSNLVSLFLTYLILEVIDKIIEKGHKDEKIFYLLEKTLFFLNYLSVERSGAKEKSYLTLLAYQVCIINIVGFLPEVSRCVMCSKSIVSGENWFSLSLGGIVGKECVSRGMLRQEDVFEVSDNEIKLIRLFVFNFGKGETAKYCLHVDRCFEIVKRLKVDQESVHRAVSLVNKFIEFNIDGKIGALSLVMNNRQRLR